MIQNFSQVLLHLSRLESIDSGDTKVAFENITEAMTEALGITRASIWFYNDNESAIVCMDLFEVKEKRHSQGAQLYSNQFPAYFNYLTEERTLPADDAHTNPATFELSEVYLKPLNIKSMLDAPIRLNGKMIGVICCEQTEKQKIWDLADQSFAGNICDIIARTLHAEKRKIALKQLEEMNANLEKLIQERTSELEEQRARSAHSSKMALLGEMAGSIAHEINNPLAIILGTANQIKTMQRKNDLTPETMNELLGNIMTTSLRIEKIIKGLRFFARDSATDNFEEASPFKIIEDTIALCRQKFKQHGCQIITNYSESSLLFKCQPVSVSQALLNLLSNSYDATENLQDRWISVDCYEENAKIIFKITDSGSGIPEEIRNKIMLPFFTTKAVGKGTGLGLAIVKGIVEHHNGEFLIEPDSKNTSFILKFPKDPNEY